MIKLTRTITLEITSEIDDMRLDKIGSEKVTLGRALEAVLKARIPNSTNVRVTRINDKLKTVPDAERRVINA